MMFPPKFLESTFKLINAHEKKLAKLDLTDHKPKITHALGVTVEWYFKRRILGDGWGYTVDRSYPEERKNDNSR